MILICGDNHSHFRHIVDAVRRYRPAGVILLGDIEARRPLDAELSAILPMTSVWFIPGNHDTDTVANWRNLADSGLAQRNLHGRVAVIDGIRVAGLGGVFRGEVWRPPGTARFANYDDYLRAQLHTRLPRYARLSNAEYCEVLSNKAMTHKSTIFPATYEALYMDQADVLVTHEAPSCHPYGFVAIDELAQALGVKRNFHGHHHDALDYRRFDTKLGFRATGVGLCGIVDENGDTVVPGRFDARDRVFRHDPSEGDSP